MKTNIERVRGRKRSLSIKEELQELESFRNAHKRGHRFEAFSARLLEEDGFDVFTNPKSASPRQTDLSARSDHTYFIVEAKWLRRPIDIGHISAVRDRLRKVPSDVFGCVLSMSGYTSGAIEEACRERNLEIILFDGQEIRGLAAGELSFTEILTEKRSALRTHASTLFHPWPAVGRFETQLRSRSDLFRTHEGTIPWMLSNTGDNDVVFCNEGLDFAGGHDRSIFSLQLNVDVESASALERLMRQLGKYIGLKDEGFFAIHQRDVGWFGFGLDNFVAAVRSLESRYAELNWASYHHSEELAYIDRIDAGGLMCLASRQSTSGGDHLHSSRVEILVPGIPVDLIGIRTLCRLTGNREANLENIRKNPVKRLRIPRDMQVEPVSTIVSSSGGQEYVSGLVVKNPFLGKPIPPGEARSLGDPFWLLSTNQYLVCALRNWHNTGILMDHYKLCFVEGCWIEHVPAFYILCDWS
jgi:hypothetical protein